MAGRSPPLQPENYEVAMLKKFRIRNSEFGRAACNAVILLLAVAVRAPAQTHATAMTDISNPRSYTETQPCTPQLTGYYQATCFGGADLGAKINNALAACPATGCIVYAPVAAGGDTLSTNIFAGVTTPAVIWFGPGTVNVSAQQLPKSGQVIQGTPGIGYPGFTMSGTVFRPTTTYPSGSPVILIDPANDNSTSANTTGNDLRDFTVDMIDQLTTTVIQINSGESFVVRGVRAPNCDGSFVVLDKSANVGSQAFTENVTFYDNVAESKSGDLQTGAKVQLNHARICKFHHNKWAAGNSQAGSSVIALAGDTYYNDFYAETLSGGGTHVTLTSATPNLTAANNTFTNIYHETGTTAYSWACTAALPCAGNGIFNPTFNGITTTGISIGAYVQHSQITVNMSAGAPPTNWVTLLANSSNNNVNATDISKVTDSGTNNFVFGSSSVVSAFKPIYNGVGVDNPGLPVQRSRRRYDINP
jgi:hypothetical protein